MCHATVETGPSSNAPGPWLESDDRVRVLALRCDKIPDPSTAEDPDLPYGGIWCSAARMGFLKGEAQRSEAQPLSQYLRGHHAFAWVEPLQDTKWVVVSGTRESRGLRGGGVAPGRVTTTDGTTLEGACAFRHRGIRGRRKEAPRAHARGGGRRIREGDAAGGGATRDQLLDYETVKPPRMSSACGAQKNLYVPFLSVSTVVFVPMNSSPESILLVLGPTSRKS